MPFALERRSPPALGPTDGDICFRLPASLTAGPHAFLVAVVAWGGGVALVAGDGAHFLAARGRLGPADACFFGSDIVVSSAVHRSPISAAGLVAAQTGEQRRAGGHEEQ